MTGAHTTSTTAPAGRSGLGWVLALTSTAYFMVALDALVVVTALPRMQQDLHVGLELPAVDDQLLRHRVRRRHHHRRGAR